MSIESIHWTIAFFVIWEVMFIFHCRRYSNGWWEDGLTSLMYPIFIVGINYLIFKIFGTYLIIYGTGIIIFICLNKKISDCFEEYQGWGV